MSARSIVSGFQKRTAWTDATLQGLLLDFVDDLEGGTHELADYLSAREAAGDPGPEEPGDDQSGGLRPGDEPGDDDGQDEPDMSEHELTARDLLSREQLQEMRGGDRFRYA